MDDLPALPPLAWTGRGGRHLEVLAVLRYAQHLSTVRLRDLLGKLFDMMLRQARPKPAAGVRRTPTGAGPGHFSGLHGRDRPEGNGANALLLSAWQ